MYAEGTSTEPEYIDALKRLPEFADVVSIGIVIEQMGVSPMTLVELACEDKRRDSHEVDFYWCVFDVESPQHHPYLDRARQMARDNGVQLAISNPCFELWLILHHCDRTAYFSTAEAVRLRNQLDGSSDKHLDAQLYMGKRADAVRRAKSLRRKHQRDRTLFPDNNPSSGFDLLIEQIASEVSSAIREASDPISI